MPLRCRGLEEIELGCERNTGGLHAVYVGDMEDIDTIVEDETQWAVTTLTALSAPVSIEIKRKTSNYIEDEQNDFVNGSVVVTTTTTLMIHRRNAEKSRALDILGAGQRYLYEILLDANGVYWFVPYAQLQSTGEGSGQERADGSKYSAVLVAENDHKAYTISGSIVASLLATS